tara:strand:+ start:464 stop:739 length:276 start_codon:yes stop_codon:yes gene_type:complete
MLIMNNKSQQKVKINFSHRPISKIVSTRRTSMRGGLVKTNDGQAIFVAIIVMLFFLTFSILSVINNDSKSEGGDDDKENNAIKKRIFRIFK